MDSLALAAAFGFLNEIVSKDAAPAILPDDIRGPVTRGHRTRILTRAFAIAQTLRRAAISQAQMEINIMQEVISLHVRRKECMLALNEILRNVNCIRLKGSRVDEGLKQSLHSTQIRLLNNMVSLLSLKLSS